MLDSRDGWMRGGKRGPAIVPHDADSSLLINAVRHSDTLLQMPPEVPLSAEEVAYLEHWVDQGAVDPRDTAQPGRAAELHDPSDPVAGKNHWAFRPLSAVAPPQVAQNTWPRSVIDEFVLARLESAGIHPADDASRVVLARRTCFRLTGLPPSEEQVSGIVQDNRPDAFERLVDELLASPHFGERWGRHWLDLARYADSNGLDENFLFREAWRYRNWVIQATNDDIPFDRFLSEQIAGDLLPFDSVEQRDRQRIGAGFMVIGPKVLLGNDAMNQQMEVADEQIDTIGRAILGQTLGCARCHDHKFDPIPAADYYALAGIMTSTNVMEKRYMLGQQRVMERLAGIGTRGDALDAAYEEFWRDKPGNEAKAKKAKAVLDALQSADESAIQQALRENADAVAPGLLDEQQTAAQRIATQETFTRKLADAIASPPEIPPRAMIPVDADKPANEQIRIAGQFNELGEEVPRGFLQVLCDPSAVAIPDGQSGRVELARWLTDVEHGAGQLAARVLVNRIWHHLMGRGIVRTMDNFGRTGEAPSHPDLLDYLAADLIQSGWSIKTIVRKIVLSRAFAMSSTHNESAYAVDPENRLHWKYNRRRLDPECLRDAMLLAAGTLDRSPMESTVWYLTDQATGVGKPVRRRTDFPCRSVYLPVIRNDLPELFDVFDFADPHSTTGGRPETNVATQSLYMLNADAVMDAAEATAQRLLECDAPSRVSRMFELVVNTPPTEAEKKQMLAFVQQSTARLAAEDDLQAELHAWSMACHALFASSRFQFLE